MTFDEAVAESQTLEIEGREIKVIGLRALLTNKRSAARVQDLADVATLAKIANLESED